MLKMKLYIKEIRITHSIKNLLVFVPCIFANVLFDYSNLNFKLFEISNILLCFIAFISFSLLTSAIYVFNDLIDYNSDCLHPIKKNRPIASGQVSKLEGKILFAVMVVLALGVGYFCSIYCLFVLFFYLIINIFYTLALKNIPLLDAFCIALGFIMRIYMGALAVSVPVSYWLLLTVFCLSLFLAFGKRRNEIINVTNHLDTRSVLKGYNKHFLDKSMYSMVTLSIVFYSLWTIDSAVIRFFDTNALIFTVPIVILVIFRYLLILEGESLGDPTEIVLNDKFLKLLIIVYAVVIISIIYI